MNMVFGFLAYPGFSRLEKFGLGVATVVIAFLPYEWVGFFGLIVAVLIIFWGVVNKIKLIQKHNQDVRTGKKEKAIEKARLAGLSEERKKKREELIKKMAAKFQNQGISPKESLARAKFDAGRFNDRQIDSMSIDEMLAVPIPDQ
jgi:hypothetical protein